MNITEKLFGWLVKGSDRNAANPTPPTSPNMDSQFPGQQPPIEVTTEQDLILGTDISLGCQDSIGYGPGGELITQRKNMSILCGCGHIVSRLQPTHEEGKPSLLGIAGKCFYCELELNEWVLRGLIAPLDAQRQSLICSNCAKITLSGKLCCPKHYAAITDESGNTIYLGPDDQAKQQELADQQARQETMQRILTPFRSLFLKQNPEQTNE